MSESSVLERPVQTKKNEVRILVGTFTSTLGSGVSVIASALLISYQHGEASNIGLLFIIVALPQAFFSFLFGQMADRFSPEKICLVANSICAIASVWIFAAVFADTISPMKLYIAAFILSSCAAVIFPATNSLIRRCVDGPALARFSAHFEIALQFGSLISVALGGVAMDLFSPAYVFLFSALSYLISGIIIAGVSYTRYKRLENAPDIASVTTHYRISGAIFLYATGSVIITVTNTLMVILVIQYFSANATSLGIADALAGGGVIMSAFLMAPLRRFLSLPAMIIMGYLLCAVCILIQPRFELVHFFILFPLGSFFYGFARIGCRQLIYSISAVNQTGRLFGIANATGLAISVPVTLLISHIVEQNGVITGYAGTAIFVAMSTVIFSVMLCARKS
ncbi:MFS transporter [Serratia fonticola]|uniref:MFS transporter n=1 Tax=Serratia fonticola TaxID=47917 RepID=UPI00192D1B40|nr:MFS transporter [Serratia fonticola]MBL5828159.1 MFS transporter [Serratia fonticola]